MLRDQSSYSSWYFIERAYIGEIHANVTIALTSTVLGGGRQQGTTARQENSTGLFSRFIGASGFQLINVNNVPLSLGSWSLDTKLLGRKAMINSLARHYFAQGISEAHKVRPSREIWRTRLEPATASSVALNTMAFPFPSRLSSSTPDLLLAAGAEAMHAYKQILSRS